MLLLNKLNKKLYVNRKRMSTTKEMVGIQRVLFEPKASTIFRRESSEYTEQRNKFKFRFYFYALTTRNCELNCTTHWQ